MNSDKKRSLFEIHLATLLLGFIAPLIKMIEAPLLTIAFGRSFLAAATIVIVLLISKTSVRLNTTRDYLVLCLLGAFQAAQWLTIYKSIRVSSVAIGLVSLFTFPIIVSLIEPIFFKERLRVSHLITAVLVLIGVVLIVPEFSLQNSDTQGLLWGLGSAILVVFPLLIHRKYVQKYSSLTLTFYKTAIAALLLIPFLFLDGLRASQFDWLIISILGILLTAAPFLLLIKSLKHLKAQQVSSIISLEVVYGIVFAWFLVHEFPSFRSLFGALIILGVAFYVSRSAGDMQTAPVVVE